MSYPETPPQMIHIRRCKRGFLVDLQPGHYMIDPGRTAYDNIHAFDRIEDVTAWLIAQYAPDDDATSTPTVAPGLPRGPVALSDAPSETDLRHGVTFIQHAVLDVVDEQAHGWQQHTNSAHIDQIKKHIALVEPDNIPGINLLHLIEASARTIHVAQVIKTGMDAIGGEA